MDITIRNNWSEKEIATLFELPFLDLLYQARTIHRQVFTDNTIQLSTLLSIKTGSCPEDCAYCPQSAHYNTSVEKHAMMDLELVKARARAAKEEGATRFCMGAGWRSPPKKEFAKLQAMVAEVKAMGLETCVTLGMLSPEQAQGLADVGLDYYNHNLDTSPEHYEKIITTRTYQDRLDTLENVRNSGIKVCCGGIMGLGETREDRIRFLQQLANLPEHPQSVPINRLIAIKGTPLEDTKELDNFEFVRVIAVARLIMPKSVVRLSAGRESMSDELHALCFFAGINSIHYGEKLLTTPLPEFDHDRNLFNRLGIKPLQTSENLQC